MKIFSELSYQRPDMGQVTQKLHEYLKEFQEAPDYETARSLFLSYQQGQMEWSTMVHIASIRNTIDTNDEFYEKEMEYFHQEMPKLSLVAKQADELLLSSPFRPQFEAEFGALFLKDMENQKCFADERIVGDQTEESRLTQKYAKTSASCTTVFRGETCNFYGLLKHMQSTDRAERKEAFEAWAALYEKIAGELDEQYDQLTQLRVGMAKKIGFESYTQMAYQERQRYDYTPEDVARFRSQVLEVIVPVCSELYRQQAERIGVDKLRYYDEALVFPDGNAAPRDPVETLVQKAGQMYRELSPQTGEFFDFMIEHRLFDLETKPGKRPGGYCTFLPFYRAPFIFSNFNGTSADVDVLTHEAGHAFEAFTASRSLPLPGQIFSTSEINEIHSMAMEHFTYPWMELFFGEDADRYRYAHLAECLEVIPYMACVDEFQHRVYENPSMGAKERRAVWHKLELKYLPWRDYDGNAFLEEGGFWMQKQHIFLYPFYYIDYALAQLGAFELYGRMKQDRARAWEDYYRLCQAGGSKGYFELLELANLSNPFQEGSVARIVASVAEELLAETKTTPSSVLSPKES